MLASVALGFFVSIEVQIDRRLRPFATAHLHPPLRSTHRIARRHARCTLQCSRCLRVRSVAAEVRGSADAVPQVEA
eukprot:6809568-Prymnesium_polylepis.2